MDSGAIEIIRQAAGTDGRIVLLTGAGISAESGIPTFRGEEGYWRVGAQDYQPREMATFAMFSRRPEVVWAWYLYRRGVCNGAKPNAAHQAIVDIESALADRFRLLTQNVDGLHIRAGNSTRRTYRVHGDINLMRCAGNCSSDPVVLPASIPPKSKGLDLTERERSQLRCSLCSGWMRPHVLWFDECYDERWYRFDSSLQAAAESDLLVVVGTSGATNLPTQVGALVARRGSGMIDINPEPNPFSQLADASPNGASLRGTAVEHLPEIARLLMQ